MILSRAGRLSLLAGLLCLLLVGFTGAANAVIRWDIFPSPTEVINIGRSEVLGSITFVVQPNQAAPITTGNVGGGDTQLGILYNNGMMVDNDITTGIRLYSNVTGLASLITVSVRNIDITGTGNPANFAGQITLNIPANLVLNIGDVIRLDGVRGRIAYSSLLTAGNDAYAQMQSVNDPAGNQFFPETIRVAKSFVPITVAVSSDTGLFCLPSYGWSYPSSGPFAITNQHIFVAENFVRAFVDNDANNDGTQGDGKDRLDSTGAALGAPTTSTRIRVALNSIPGNVDFISWPSVVSNGTFGQWNIRVSSGNNVVGYTKATVGGTPNGTAFAEYIYHTTNQTSLSDTTLETYDFRPALGWNSTPAVPDTSLVRAGAALYPLGYGGDSNNGIPAEPNAGVLFQPYGSNIGASMPRFMVMYFSGTLTSTGTLTNMVTDTSITGTVATTQFGVYASLAPCQCYMLFTYTTKDSFWDTGIVVANTSDDSGAITAGKGASDQAGTITFWLYDYRMGNVTPAAGVYLADPTHYSLPVGGTNLASDATGQPIYYAGQSVRGLVSQLVANASITATLASKGYTDFAGYVIGKANFQFCHGYAFVADKTFANIAQGYLANIIPDPNVTGKRTAINSGYIPYLAGEGIDN